MMVDLQWETGIVYMYVHAHVHVHVHAQIHVFVDRLLISLTQRT